GRLVDGDRAATEVADAVGQVVAERRVVHRQRALDEEDGSAGGTAVVRVAAAEVAALGVVVDERAVDDRDRGVVAEDRASEPAASAAVLLVPVAAERPAGSGAAGDVA